MNSVVATSDVVEVEELRKLFPIKTSFFSRSKYFVHAVNGVNFSIRSQETFGLAGESGCGKTTLGRLIMRLIQPTSGRVFFEGDDIFKLAGKRVKALRRNMQMIFQDSFASLNPRKTIYQILSRPLLLYKAVSKNEIEKTISELLSHVGLKPQEDFFERYPYELSGGQRQRVGIARALALRPKFIVADEPVSALDVSTRADILKLMKKLRYEFNLTCLFITHDLAVLRSISDRAAIMYLGKIVELAETQEIFSNHLHPYTEALLSSTPIPDPRASRRRKRFEIVGEVPSAINPPPGCRFHPRCPQRRDRCSSVEPPLVEIGEGHLVACHLHI